MVRVDVYGNRLTYGLRDVHGTLVSVGLHMASAGQPWVGRADPGVQRLPGCGRLGYTAWV